jgi:hypothetical protein
MQNLKLEREVKEQSGLGEIHSGGKGPHWTVVPLREKKKGNKRKRK